MHEVDMFDVLYQSPTLLPAITQYPSEILLQNTTILPKSYRIVLRLQPILGGSLEQTHQFELHVEINLFVPTGIRFKELSLKHMLHKRG